jgi:hypothetical protein
MNSDPNFMAVLDDVPTTWRYLVWAFGYGNTAAFASLVPLLFLAPFCVTGDRDARERKAGRFYAFAHVQALFFQLMLVAQGLYFTLGGFSKGLPDTFLRLCWQMYAQTCALYLGVGAAIHLSAVGFVWRYSERAPKPRLLAGLALLAPCACGVVFWCVCAG